MAHKDVLSRFVGWQQELRPPEFAQIPPRLAQAGHFEEMQKDQENGKNPGRILTLPSFFLGISDRDPV